MRKKTKSGSLADQTLIAKLRLRFPLIVAPMAGGPSSPSLVSEASRAGALGSMGAAYSNAAAIEEFAATVRKSTDRPFGINLFVPHSMPEISSVSKLGTQLIAAGGILDSNGIQAALRKGAQAVEMGTAFLACHEAGTSNPYRAKLLDPSGRKTRTTRVFSGRLARGMENRFMEEMQTRSILPFPAQNSFTRDIRSASAAKRSADFLSLWSGTGKGNLWQGSVAELIERLFPQPDLS